MGERYSQVTDQSILYALGLWGEEGSRLMDPAVKDRILDRPRARELAKWQPPQPSIAEIRKGFERGLSDDDLLLRWLITKDEFNAMRAAGPATPYTGNGVLGLLENLRGHKANQVYIRKPGLRLALQGSAS